MAYVALSRARLDAHVFTDSTADLGAALDRQQNKEIALDALDESQQAATSIAAESRAADTHASTSENMPRAHCLTVIVLRHAITFGRCLAQAGAISGLELAATLMLASPEIYSGLFRTVTGGITGCGIERRQQPSIRFVDSWSRFGRLKSCGPYRAKRVAVGRFLPAR